MKLAVPNRVRLLCGDAAEQLSRLRDVSIDLTVFSPPYDNIRTYTSAGYSFDYPAIGRELYRVTKDGGVCAVVINDTTKNFRKSLTTYRMILDWVDNAGWGLFENCIYRRSGIPGKFARFRIDHEYLPIFFKGQKPKSFDKSSLAIPTLLSGKDVYRATRRENDGKLYVMDAKKKGEVRPIGQVKCRGTVWDISPTNTERNPLKTYHPATFPDRLAEDLIRCFSKPGDLVLDPYLGSGTTAVKAVQNGRRVIGIDISPEYLQLAFQRLVTETGYWLGEEYAP